MEADTQPKLSKKLQIVTLFPLLLGILVCTLVILAILFSNYLDWISATTTYIENKQFESMERLAQAATNVYTSKIEQVLSNQLSFELYALKNLYENTEMLLQQNATAYITTEFAYENPAPSIS